jgi:hypothetical protein
MTSSVRQFISVAANARLTKHVQYSLLQSLIVKCYGLLSLQRSVRSVDGTSSASEPAFFFKRRVYEYISFTYKPGPGSVVGIATGYGLDGPGIESWWGATFSAPVQTGHGAHPASCTMGVGSFPGVKSGRGVTLIPHPLLVPWS